MNKRQKEVIQHQLTMEKVVLDELEKEYKEALKDINLKIQMYQAMPETQSRIYHRQYQETLKKQIEAALEKLHSDEYTTINEYLHDSYTDAFVGTMYDLHGQGTPVIAPIDQNAAIKAVMTDTRLNKPLYTKLGIDVNKLKRTVSSEISRGIAAGMAYAEIARNIEFRTNAPFSRAKTIVRTEGHRIQQASAEDARQASKARGADVVKMWDSTMDGKTRTTHRQLDGQIRETDEPFELGTKKAMYPGDFGDPAEDCNCRCVALTRSRSALDADELETLKKRAEFFELDKTKDFEDFKQKYLKAAEANGEIRLTKPKRPKRSEYDDEEEYAEARSKYRKEKAAYNESLENWVNAQIPETAMTRHELEEWCAKNGIRLENIDGMDMRAFNAFTKRWEELSRDYPLSKKLYYSTGDVIDRRTEIEYVQDTSFFAEASHGMTFGKTFRDYEETLHFFGDQMSDGFNVWGAGNINTMFDHEYGHSLQASIKYRQGMTTEKCVEMDRDLVASCVGKEGISEYALTNTAELFAEGFAAYYGGEKTEFANAFGEFLKRWL